MEAVSDDDVIKKFRFQKRDVYRLQNAAGFPDEITCHFYNDLRVEPTEALSILLNRPAYPCRYADMVPLFGRAPPQLSMTFNQTVDVIDTNWGHLLQYFNQSWLSRPCLQVSLTLYAEEKQNLTMCGISLMVQFVLFAD